MEDDLKIFKVEYLSKHSSDTPQILNLTSGDQTKMKNAWHKDNRQWKTTSKYKKLNISATTGKIILKFETLANGIKLNVNKFHWIL